MGKYKGKEVKTCLSYRLVSFFSNTIHSTCWISSCICVSCHSICLKIYLLADADHRWNTDKEIRSVKDRINAHYKFRTWQTHYYSTARSVVWVRWMRELSRAGDECLYLISQSCRYRASVFVVQYIESERVTGLMTLSEMTSPVLYFPRKPMTMMMMWWSCAVGG